jgi:hypothetical protein
LPKPNHLRIIGMPDEFDLQQQRISERADLLWRAAGSPSGGADEFRCQAKAEIMREEAGVDAASEDSFPASDPPASTPTTGPRAAPEKPRSFTAPCAKASPSGGNPSWRPAG